MPRWSWRRSWSNHQQPGTLEAALRSFWYSSSAPTASSRHFLDEFRSPSSLGPSVPTTLTLLAILLNWGCYLRVLLSPSAPGSPMIPHNQASCAAASQIHDPPLLVLLAKRYVWSARRARRGVSRALFHLEIASESNFYLESHFGLFLRQFARWTVDDVVKSSDQI